MKKEKVYVSDIGMGRASDSEKQFRIKYRTFLKDMGMLPLSYDQENKQLPKYEGNYTSQYKTREEFDRDRNFIINAFSNDNEIPQELYNKVKLAVQEIKEKYNIIDGLV